MDLAALAALRSRVDAAFVGDHVCFGSVGGLNGHDRWPMPLTEERLQGLIARVREGQDRLGFQLVLENVSSYVEFDSSTLFEADFLRELLDGSDAGMLLDVNNVYVSAHNFGFDARACIDALPRSRVRTIHLAGHHDAGAYRLDDHVSPVSERVWSLHEYALSRLGPTPTIVE